MNGAIAKGSALRRSLDGSLFRQAPAGRRSGVHLVLILAGLVALGVVLQLLRLGWSAPLHSLWAEDGPVFLQGALHHGFVANLFTPYERYLVVVPRLIAAGAAALPLSGAPVGTSILAAVTVSMSGVVVWAASAGQIGNPYLRAGLACTVVLVPLGDVEAVANPTNVGWFLLFGAFWVLLWRPRSVASAGLGAAFLLLGGLSTVGVLMLAPVAALRLVAARTKADRLILGAFALAAAAQILVELLNSQPVTQSSWSNDVWPAYVQRVVGSGLLGQTLSGDAWTTVGLPIFGALLIAAIAAVAYAAPRAGICARWFVGAAIITSLLLFVVAAYGRGLGTELLWPAGKSPEIGARYTIVPGLLLLSAAIVLVDDAWRRSRLETLSPVVVVALTALAAVVATSFYVGDPAVRGSPTWSQALAAAGLKCKLSHERLGTIAISPPSWYLKLPCGELARYAPTGAPRQAGG